MNDAKTDPRGVYWSGISELDLEPGHGWLWRTDEKGEPTPVIEGLTLPNGLGWSPDGKTFYLVSSQQQVVFQYADDPQTSELNTTRRILIGRENFSSQPNGSSVGTPGHLWLTEFAGARLHEFAPDTGSIFEAHGHGAIGLPAAKFRG